MSVLAFQCRLRRLRRIRLVGLFLKILNLAGNRPKAATDYPPTPYSYRVCRQIEIGTVLARRITGEQQVTE